MTQQVSSGLNARDPSDNDPKTPSPRQVTPRRRVRAALGSVAMLLLVGGLVGCGDDEPARDEEGAISEAGDLAAESIRVGDCFDDPEGVDSAEGAEFSSVAAVSCADPHDNEVYHRFDLPDGDFPGREAVDELAGEGCIEPFEEYVGASYEDSELDIFTISPTESTWKDFDDREVVCAVYAMSGEKLTDSVQGSGR